MINVSFYAQGRLLLIGGGSEKTGTNAWNYQAFRWLTDNSTNKRVAVIGYESGGSTLVNDFKTYWGASWAKEFVINSSNADLQATYDSLITYDIVYFRGGDQYYYYTYYKGKKTQQAIEYIFSNGGAIAGTSAGMHILTKVLFTAYNGSVYPDECIENPLNNYITLQNDFFPFLNGFVGDTHFAERGRFARLLGFMANWKFLHNENVVGIGIDDQTALAIETNNNATVYGSGCANFYIADNNTFSQNPANTGKLLASNVKVMQLKQGNSINLNTLQITNNSENNTNVVYEQENLPCTIYISGSDILSDNNAMLGAFVNTLSSFADTILILTSTNQTIANTFKTKLNDLGATNVFVYSAISANGSYVQLSVDINRAKAFLFVNNTYTDFIEFLNTYNGYLLKNKLIKATTISVFVGDNSRFAGARVIENYLTDYASYDSLMTFPEGLKLLQTTVVMPNTYKSSAMYENAVTSVPFVMNHYGLAYGVWLYNKNYMKYYNTNGKTYFKGFGSAPVMVLHNTSTKWGHVTQTPSGTPPARQITSFDQMHISLIDESTPMEVGNQLGLEFLKNNHFYVYPNPVANKFFVENLDFESLKIYNIQGIEVLCAEKTNDNFIDVSHLPSGVYTIEVKLQSSVLTGKFVKK